MKSGIKSCMVCWGMRRDNFLSILPDFLTFIYKPNSDKVSGSFGRKILKLLFLFLIVLIARITLSFMNGFFISSPLKEDINHPDLVFLLLSCSLIPIIEEIAFRLPLLFSPRNVSLSSGIISFYLINRLFGLENQFDTGNYFFLRIMMAAIIGGIVWMISNRNVKDIKPFYGRNLSLMVYTYSLIFAVMHIGNYDRDSNVLLAYLLLTIPHFISALMYSFARLKYGFSYSVGLHIVNNSIPAVFFAVSGIIRDVI